MLFNRVNGKSQIKTLFKKRNLAALPLLSLAVLGACGPTEHIEITSEKPAAAIDGTSRNEQAAPLREQHESKYVTDSSRWGKLVFNRSNLENEPKFNDDFAMLADIIEDFHSQWLDRDENGIARLLDSNAVRFRQGRAAYGKDDVLAMIRQESRGERPEGYKSSMHLTIRNVQLRVEGDSASALYRVDVRGGARWEYADLATILQIFRKSEDGWKIVGHAETLALGDATAPTLPDTVPTRVSPFRFDFVYPVENLERAIDFYAPLLGDPIVVTASRASFRFSDSFFELTSSPIDDRIVIKKGSANGYAIIDVGSLESIARKLANAGTTDFRETQCESGKCIVSEDPSGNVIVWREPRSDQPSRDAQPSVNIDGADPDRPIHRHILTTMRAWMYADMNSVLDVLDSNATWVDDQYDIASGAARIESALRSRWTNLGATDGGLDGELTITNVHHQRIGDREVATFEMSLRIRDSAKSSFKSLVMQVWDAGGDGWRLEQAFLIRARESSDRLVGGMDYTGYPAINLGMAGRYYKTMFDSEPYRDDNYFGFWSTSSVFGLVGSYPDVDAYRPVPHRSNGYADLSIRSAEEVYDYLKSKGATFPLVVGINDQPGIDSQPGYRQVLAVDSEGNLVKFNQYLEY